MQPLRGYSVNEKERSGTIGFVCLMTESHVRKASRCYIE